jgi:DNA modification methylase
MPDYILKFRKPGDNPVPVVGGMTGDEWIELANPTWPNEHDRAAEWGAWATWYGIAESDTLQGWQAARGNDDERHICPLQLGTIERCIRLWTNPGETVLDPFNGIGSTGDQALRMERKYIGIELKPEYWQVSVRNLKAAEADMNTPDLFSWAASVEDSGYVTA